MKSSKIIGNALPDEPSARDRGIISASLLNKQRADFIETLSQELLAVKGYGLYAYLSTGEVIHLFERYLEMDISAKVFAKAYVRNL
jgi:hypothetical protein